jgi:hypothetical protein
MYIFIFATKIQSRALSICGEPNTVQSLAAFTTAISESVMMYYSLGRYSQSHSTHFLCLENLPAYALATPAWPASNTGD